MTRLSVPDMSCGHCKASVEKALSGLATDVQVDLGSRLVSAKGDEGAMIAALAKVGFPAVVIAAN